MCATFAKAGFTPVDGSNTYTAIAKDGLGRQDTNSITDFLPATATYTDDLNGNLTSDGTRYFAYGFGMYGCVHGLQVSKVYQE